MRNLKESFLKVDGPFLPLTSPVPITFTRFLACTFRKVWSTSNLKRFCPCPYIFGITTYPLMDEWFTLLALKHAPKQGSWGLDGTRYWRLFIAEYLQPNKLNERPKFDPTRFLVFLCWTMHHVSMYFLGRAVFLSREKRSCFREKVPSFQIIQERSCAGVAPTGKTIFSEGLKKISYYRVFFKKDHLSFSA